MGNVKMVSESFVVIPAEAGSHDVRLPMDSRFRGNDVVGVWSIFNVTIY
jgi:hypothetical protein